MKYIRAHERGGIDRNTSFTPLRFIRVLVPTQNRGWTGICILGGIDFVSVSIIFVIGFYNCSDSMVLWCIIAVCIAKSYVFCVLYCGPLFAFFPFTLGAL